MQLSAEKIIAPLVILGATSVPAWYEIPIGNFGLSVEHLLLLVYLLAILFRKHTHTKIEFGFVAIVTTITAILGSIFIHIGNAHLGSLVVLCLMFPLFIKYFENINNPRRVINYAFLLIFLQCIFFSHASLEFKEEWDYLVIPGFGYIPRLAILGFVSNSLGLMLFPFYIYFLHLAQTTHVSRNINALLTICVLIIVVLTFSRTALMLIMLATLLMSGRKTLLITLLLIIFLLAINPFDIIELLQAGFFREDSIAENSRVSVWNFAFSNWHGQEIIIGRGIQNPPLDNTYISIITGAGIIGIFILFAFFITLGRWIFRIKKCIKSNIFNVFAIIILSILVSANTYDIFSQRKIIFGIALIISGLISNHDSYLHFRR